MPSILNATTTSGLVTSADNSGSLQLQTNSGTTAVTINTSQGVQFLNSISVGNATPTTSGAGITFPATQSASSDANTLDDYEEGTWTPTMVSGFTSPTYGVQAGRYTRVGRICYFSLHLLINGGTRANNIVQISLPFTTPTFASGFGGAAYWSYASPEVINSTTTNLPLLYIGSGVNRVDFYMSDGNGFNGVNYSGTTPNHYIVGWQECA